MTDSRDATATATAQGQGTGTAQGQGQGREQPAPAQARPPAPTPALELYPQYCFHLSPTINKWCHLRAADIVALESHPGFQGQDLYFHLNHPIKWVRICGIVVAVDVYGDAASRKGQIQVVTIDDGSGEVMECVIPLGGSGATAATNAPPPAAAGPFGQAFGQQQRQHQVQQRQHAQQQQQQHQKQQAAQTLPVIDSSIDIGHTLDIKGSLRTYRDQRQLKVEKIVHLHKTEQEVAFWERIVQLRREVLNKPWVLEDKVVRRLKREAMGVDPEGDRKRKERERQKEEGRREWKRVRRLQQLEEEGQRGRLGVEGKAEEGEGEVAVEKDVEEEEKERKRMRRLEQERRTRELAAIEEETSKRKASEELEEREKERKRMKRLEEERMRLESQRQADRERTVTAASGFITARQVHEMAIPTRTKRNVTGLERRMPVSRGPPIQPRPKEPTGLERKSKSSREGSKDRVVPVEVTGKYKALGL